MSVFVTNDLHGDAVLIERVVNAIKIMRTDDILIINGDGAGSRGPRMSKIVKKYYEVKRGETDFENLVSALAEIIGEKPEFPKDWVFGSVHAGIFRKLLAERYERFRQCTEAEVITVLGGVLQSLSQAANGKVRILYVPGNGEMLPGDFSVNDISIEQALPPEERFYQKIAREGFFGHFGIEYIPYAYNLDGIALLSTNLLDLDLEKAVGIIRQYKIPAGEELRAVVVHYPPVISPIGRTFSFWSPNKVDVLRIDALNKILKELHLKHATIFFGHIHLDPDDPRMASYPPIMGFKINEGNAFWVKPGELIEIGL